MQSTSTPFAWALDHLSVVGWPALCVAVYKFARFLSRMEQRASVVEDNINTISANHLSHMESSLQSIDATLQRQEQRWEAWITAQAAHNRKD